MKVQIVNKSAYPTPAYATEKSAGMDLKANIVLAQLNPKSGLTTGCMKQHISGFLPAANFDREKLAQTVREQNKGAVKVAVLWLLVNGLFGALYLRKILSAAELILLCAFYYLVGFFGVRTACNSC